MSSPLGKFHFSPGTSADIKNQMAEYLKSQIGETGELEKNNWDGRQDTFAILRVNCWHGSAYLQFFYINMPISMSDKRQRCVEIKCLMNWKSHIEVLLIVVLLNSVRDRVFFGRSIEESALLLERTVLSPSRDISPDHVAVKTRHMILGLSRTKRWSGMLFFL